MAQQAEQKAKYNPENGGSHLEVEPLDPRQGQPVDMAVPHAMDQVLPDTNPNVQQPSISPVEGPSTLRADPGKVAPGQYKRAPKYTDLKVT